MQPWGTASATGLAGPAKFPKPAGTGPLPCRWAAKPALAPSPACLAGQSHAALGNSIGDLLGGSCKVPQTGRNRSSALPLGPQTGPEPCSCPPPQWGGAMKSRSTVTSVRAPG